MYAATCEKKRHPGKPPIDSSSCQRSLLVNRAEHNRLIVEVSRHHARSFGVSNLIKNTRVRLDKRCTVNSFAPQWSRWTLNANPLQPQKTIRIRKRAPSKATHPRRRRLTNHRHSRNTLAS
ncbi:hypothetical protein [Corynebacterium accolens]|uniref:hypothetical protein n=1 Tax=Corynebacterium accolens TaxID=38284 RepID=UPI002670585C|nr:hypothetical protein [Corynebacterium accolens]WKS64402.1 hypothetical protein NLL51_09765 [Corynebacterium accolens]